MEGSSPLLELLTQPPYCEQGSPVMRLALLLGLRQLKRSIGGRRDCPHLTTPHHMPPCCSVAHPLLCSLSPSCNYTLPILCSSVLYGPAHSS